MVLSKNIIELAMIKMDGIHRVFPKIVMNGKSIDCTYENPIPPGIIILIISIFLE